MRGNSFRCAQPGVHFPSACPKILADLPTAWASGLGSHVIKFQYVLSSVSTSTTTGLPPYPSPAAASPPRSRLPALGATGALLPLGLAPADLASPEALGRALFRPRGGGIRPLTAPG